MHEATHRSTRDRGSVRVLNDHDTRSSSIPVTVSIGVTLTQSKSITKSKSIAQPFILT